MPPLPLNERKRRAIGRFIDELRGEGTPIATLEIDKVSCARTSYRVGAGECLLSHERRPSVRV